MQLSDKIDINNFDCKRFPLNLLHLLQESSCTIPRTGWQPIFFSNKSTILPAYVKGHSYGDYIFDWAWADLFSRLGIEYYPKLVHSLPFTPINAPKFIPEINKEVLEEAISFYKNQPINSHHFLFISEKLAKILENYGYQTQKTIQYHFKNKYLSFDNFLETLKTRKRKQIKKEIQSIDSYNLTFELLRGDELTEKQCIECYELYMSTISKKRAIPYLTKDFFKGIPTYLGENFLVLLAQKDNVNIAMSTFFINEGTLYGRYWGIAPQINNMPNLHFYMCYYYGIKYVIKEELKIFEAGAQGEQKLLRGFTPVEILSSHHIKNDQARTIIFNHILNQNVETTESIRELKRYLPYKTTL